MRPAKQSALVTGGAKRIGRAIVLDLAANGFAVAIHCGQSRAEAEKLAAGISDSGGSAYVLQADLTDTTQAGRLVEEAEAALGPIGLLVNNASVFEEDSVTDFADETWDRHFALHVKAPAILAREFVRFLPQDHEGMIVNMIDQRVWKPTPRHFSYTLSKAALWTATRTMAQALGPRIRVNAIGPGPTLPDRGEDEASFRRQTAGLILGRGPNLSEFGATIRYLWETPSVTGQMIALDGGKHLAWNDAAGGAA
ncbi:SDR family oxidoreductase [Chelativorans sp. AA-79]|uniref:SDR family oxidoreductase n=1 Tax=Chelativorans sp. AA-79 TaxID=3028735 RepID=UPI0023F75AFE|nr:SDR family oxidoreductase [Chelativorans sp. AA-79]WEX07605.1 SDR family oxidoreductase [Chelativorans sp. AA-79]